MRRRVVIWCRKGFLERFLDFSLLCFNNMCQEWKADAASSENLFKNQDHICTVDAPRLIGTRREQIFFPFIRCLVLPISGKVGDSFFNRECSLRSWWIKLSRQPVQVARLGLELQIKNWNFSREKQQTWPLGTKLPKLASIDHVGQMNQV